MLREVHDADSFVTFGVAAFDVEIVVHFLKCFTEYGGDVFCRCPTAIGTLAIFFFS